MGMYVCMCVYVCVCGYICKCVYMCVVPLPERFEKRRSLWLWFLFPLILDILSICSEYLNMSENLWSSKNHRKTQIHFEIRYLFLHPQKCVCVWGGGGGESNQIFCHTTAKSGMDMTPTHPAPHHLTPMIISQ